MAKYTFEGYDFSVALYEERDLIKTLVAALAGFNYFTGFDWKLFLVSVGTVAITLAGKLALNALHYYFNE